MEMTLYEMNAQAILQMDWEDPFTMAKTFEKFYYSDYTTTKHFMLLCKDINYYTIFEKNNDIMYSSDFNIYKELEECVEPFGSIKTLYVTQSGTLELWTVNKFDEILCFLFFPCDDWMVNTPW